MFGLFCGRIHHFILPYRFCRPFDFNCDLIIAWITRIFKCKKFKQNEAGVKFLKLELNSTRRTWCAFLILPFASLPLLNSSFSIPERVDKDEAFLFVDEWFIELPCVWSPAYAVRFLRNRGYKIEQRILQSSWSLLNHLSFHLQHNIFS